MADLIPGTYRTGRSLGTTVYRIGEDQPCGWFPNDPALAEHVVRLLNRSREAVLSAADTVSITCRDCQAVITLTAGDLGPLTGWGGPYPWRCPRCEGEAHR